MAVLVSDSFNRADSTTTLGTTDSYNGGTAQAWSIYNGGAFGISTNQAYTPTVHIDNTAYVDVTPQTDNVKISLTIANSNVIINGIAFRIQDANNFFRAYVVGTTLKIDRKTTGTWSNIYSVTITGTTATFPLPVSIGLSGSTITPYVNGVQQSIVTDANFQTATQHGLYINNNSTIKQDNFFIEATSTGGTGASITSVVASSTNSAVAPSVSTQSQVSVSSVVANSSAVGIVPSVSITANVAVSSVLASTTASAIAPSVGSNTNVTISSVAAPVNAQAVSPVVSAQQQVSIAGTVANSAVSAGVPNVFTGTSISVTVNAVAASSAVNAVNPAIGTSSNVNIVAAVTNATAIVIAPIVSTIRNVVINPVVAVLAAQALIPTVLLNSSQIIGIIPLKGSRDLYVYLKGSRDLTINLKGSI